MYLVMGRFLKSWTAAVVGGSLYAFPALACMFHANSPTISITDTLRQAGSIVLARDNGSFGFEAVDALRGTLEDVEIPYLADTATVRKLSRRPNDAVLFARAADTGLWHRVAYVDDPMRNVLGDLMNRIAEWPGDYGEARFAFFAALYNHPHAGIRRLAQTELDMAPYGLLRTLRPHVDAEAILRDLRSFTGYDRVFFKYLLLGISGAEIARKELHRAVEAADRRMEASLLGAAATALIEIDGLRGLERLETLFLQDPSEPIIKLERVIQALAIHNQIGTEALRAGIASALSRVLDIRPDSGPIVAKYLADTNDWSQVDAMERLLKSRQLRNFGDVMLVANYVTRARRAQAIE